MNFCIYDVARLFRSFFYANFRRIFFRIEKGVYLVYDKLTTASYTNKRQPGLHSL